MFNDILNYGVNIVTVTPERVYRHDSTDPTDSIIAIVELARGNSESTIKSQRVGKAWRKRKKAAVETKAPVSEVAQARGRQVPADPGAGPGGPADLPVVYRGPRRGGDRQAAQ